MYALIGADGKPHASAKKGTVGGHRGTKIFGRLDCPAARRAIARGQYVSHRVFFADPATAAQAGYRPCAVCMPGAYQTWKATRQTGLGDQVQQPRLIPAGGPHAARN
jgi:methylphosphotriester-DNA--protein-cysteine methyltransferase